MKSNYVTNRMVFTYLFLIFLSHSILAQMECGHFNPKISQLDPIADAEKIKELKKKDDLSAIKELIRIKHEVSNGTSINLKYDSENKLKFLRILQEELYYLVVESETLLVSSSNTDIENLLLSINTTGWDFYDYVADHEGNIRANDFSFLKNYPEPFILFEDAYYNLDSKINESCIGAARISINLGCYSLVKYQHKLLDIVQTYQEIIQKVEAEETVLTSPNNFVMARNSENKRIAVVFHYVVDKEEFADQDRDLVEMSNDILDDLNKYFNSTDYFSLYMDGYIPTNPHTLFNDWVDLNAAPNIEFSLAKLKIDEDRPDKATPTSGVEVRYMDEFWLGRRAIKRWELGGLNAWDTKTYLNIWISNDRDHVYEGGFKLLGSASFPESYYNWTNEDYDYRIHDGVWVNTQALLPDRMANTGEYYRGKVIHHEFGHYFGLFHTHAKSKIYDHNDGCAMDDGLLDTPRTNGEKEYFTNDQLMAVGGTPQPCGEGEYEMYHNFMGYSTPFTSSFTPQQVEVMDYHLENERAGLLTLSHFRGQVSNGDLYNGFVGDYEHSKDDEVDNYSMKEATANPVEKVWPNAYSCKGPLNIEVSVPVYSDRSRYNNRPYSIRLLQLSNALGRVISVIDNPTNAIVTEYERNDVHRKYRIQIEPKDIPMCSQQEKGIFFFNFRLTDDVFGSEYHGTEFGGKVVMKF
ncbi:M43 family zinc metalloprotease [Bacteriovoracaceae bacterium]|nr:M43 family zinc metalloprotease [Bacteriovoracaceae bacterium]